MNAPHRGIPLRPDPDALARAAAASVIRAAICLARGELEKPTRPSEIARRDYADDRGLDFVMRAAVSPTSVAGAPALTQIGVAFLDVLRPVSAGADLLARGIQLSFDGNASITVPGIALPTAGFVGEGAPIPIVQAPTAPGPTLSPHKVAVITTLTGEILRSSNAETLARQVLAEACGPALDAVLFSAVAASPDHPAGLLAGIAALTPSASTEKAAALVDDLQALATAIAPVAANGDIAIICAPAQAVALALRIPSELAWPVLSSASLAAGVVIATAVSAIVSAIEGPPQIDASQHAELHRDTTPGEITTAAGTIAYPVGSLFQTDEVGLRLRWPVSWGLRSPSGIAWMSGVSW